MVNLMVERATSDMLIGPDWAMNIEICDVCNRDPAQAKDVVRGIKKRLVSRNPKVQLLALTLLETIVKNCGEMVHMHVAEKDLPHEMVKIVRKKPDFNVKEKILILIDTWQESFGGSAARYPQFIVAYQDLLRLGAVFPQRPENFAPIFTPAQTHPLTSYPQNVRNTESRPDAAETSAETEFPTLSMTEIQNARGIMDVLVEMLSALGPGNKEGIKQEVIVDLVEQCRTYKQRVVHLVNSTVDESLLCEGLTLNDDLQRILAKHESIASGATSSQLENPKPDLAQSLPPVDAPLIDTGGGSSQLENGSTSGTSLGAQLSLPAPPTSNGQLTTSKRVDPKIDLLSGDDFNSPTANSLALVPVGEALPAGPVTSQQNALALIDMFPQSNNDQSLNSIGQQANPSSPQFHHQPNFQSPYPKGSGSGPMLAQFEQSQSLYSNSAAWNGQMTQQQQPPSPVYGSENSALPPPPWEAQLDSSQSAISQSQEMQVAHAQPQPSPSGSYLQGSPTVANNQNPVFGMYMQSMAGSHLAPVNNQANQMPNMYPHQTGMYPYPQPMQSAQMGYMYPQQMYGNNMAGYGYGYGHGQGQQANTQYLDQSMSGLSVRDENALRNSSYSVASPYVPSEKPSKPEDKLFADLVDMSKFKKPAKTSM